MTAVLAPIPFLRYTSTSTGLALIGGQVFTFAAGTTTPQATYTDSTGTVANTNPIILNARGECTCYLNPSLSYKFVFKDALGNTISTYDNVRSLDYDHSVFYAEDFGAVGDGVTDSTSFIQAAIDQAPAGSIVAFGVGNFKFSSITVSKALTLRGSGKIGSTILTCSSATLDAISVTTVNPVEICEMQIQASVTRTAGAFIKVAPASGSNFDACIRRVEFVSPWIGINFLDAADFTVEDCYFANYGNIGIQVADVASPDSGDSTIFNNTFDAGGSGTGTAILQNSSGGLRILCNKFLNGNFHYLGSFVSAPTNTSILLIQGNSSEFAKSANFALTASSATTFSCAVIENNQLTVAGAVNAIGIQVTDPGYAFLDTLTIGGNFFNLDTNTVGMNLGRGQRVSVLPNQITAEGAGHTAISFGANIGAATVYPQDIRDVTTRYGGTMTNVTFVPGGLVQTATNTDTTNAAYGTLFTTPTRAVTFATAYPKPPTVAFQMAGNGAVSCVFTVVPTTTGFTYQAIGAVNASSISVTWTATGG